MQNVTFLETIARCARQGVVSDDQSQDFDLWQSKSKDPAKMTYSIPDFMSRNGVNLPIY